MIKLFERKNVLKMLSVKTPSFLEEFFKERMNQNKE